jgi:hypothetical protein
MKAATSASAPASSTTNNKSESDDTQQKTRSASSASSLADDASASSPPPPASSRRAILIAGGFALQPLLARWSAAAAATEATTNDDATSLDETTRATALQQPKQPSRDGTAVKKTVLVLGATGRVGSAATRTLLRRGHDVRAVVRSAAGLPPDLMRYLDATSATGYLEDGRAAGGGFEGAVLTVVEASVLDLGGRVAYHF